MSLGRWFASGGFEGRANVFMVIEPIDDQCFQRLNFAWPKRLDSIVIDEALEWYLQHPRGLHAVLPAIFGAFLIQEQCKMSTHEKMIPAMLFTAHGAGLCRRGRGAWVALGKIGTFQVFEVRGALRNIAMGAQQRAPHHVWIVFFIRQCRCIVLQCGKKVQAGIVKNFRFGKTKPQHLATSRPQFSALQSLLEGFRIGQIARLVKAIQNMFALTLDLKKAFTELGELPSLIFQDPPWKTSEREIQSLFDFDHCPHRGSSTQLCICHVFSTQIVCLSSLSGHKLKASIYANEIDKQLIGHILPPTTR